MRYQELAAKHFTPHLTVPASIGIFYLFFPRSDKKINKDTPCFVANDDSEIFEPVRLVFEKKPFTANWQPVTNPDIEQFDWEKLTFPLEIRRPIRGDYFYPLGLGGKKKNCPIFFVDLKLTTIENLTFSY